ncbi:sodium channel protein Nach-like [Arctopsyche grandis]|uniref:sodium channel protein Nach-like n=1 Tax=Arctopsyche grandis TaxID=121162 RepID=UPI00406D8F91
MDDMYYVRSTYYRDRDKFPIRRTAMDPSTLLTISEMMSKNDHKAPKANPKKKNKFASGMSEFFTDFCNETTIHGFNHIVAPKRHIIEKIGWAIVTILAALGAVQLCRQQWQRYVENPTVVSLEKDYRMWNNTFLALTACMEDRVLAANAVKMIENLWNVKEGDTKFDYYMKFIQVVANATMKNLDRFQEYVNDVTLKDVDLFKIVDEVSPPFIVTSNWFDQSLNLPFVRVMTDLGICYTINSVVSKNHAIRNTKEQFDDYQTEPVSCQYVTHPCYAKMETSRICVKYFIHSPYEIIDMTSNVVAEACPSQDFDTDWKVMETKSSEDVKALAIDQRNCRYHTEPLYNKQQVYSVGICRRGCRNALALKLCNCRPFFNFQESGPQCDVTGMACLAKYEKRLYDSCNCLPQCIDATYELADMKENKCTFHIPHSLDNHIRSHQTNRITNCVNGQHIPHSTFFR